MEDNLPNPNNIFNIEENALFYKIEELKKCRDEIKGRHPEIFEDKSQFISFVSVGMAKGESNEIKIDARYSDNIPTHIKSEVDSCLKKVFGK
jgi:hypothetical protein